MKIEPGTFRMGSPLSEDKRDADEAPHRITLTKSYYLGVHLVTQQQWQQVMGKEANKSEFMGKDEEEKERLPVDSVSWDDCQEFCRKLGALEGRRYRLPTEAEWEYACRAGTTTAFWWGDYITTDRANYNGNWTYGPDGKEGEYRKKTTPIDYFKPNPWGLYDMHGNLWQWCEDIYTHYGNGDKIDPLNAGRAGMARVLRGGSWDNAPWHCRDATRHRFSPDGRYNVVGFRLIVCLDEAVKRPDEKPEKEPRKSGPLHCGGNHEGNKRGRLHACSFWVAQVKSSPVPLFSARPPAADFLRTGKLLPAIDTMPRSWTSTVVADQIAAPGCPDRSTGCRLTTLTRPTFRLPRFRASHPLCNASRPSIRPILHPQARNRCVVLDVPRDQ